MAGSLQINYSKEDTLSEYSLESSVFDNNKRFIEESFNNFIYNNNILPNFDKKLMLETEVFLISDDEIKEINQQYRNKCKATDVISLAFYEDFRVESRDESLPQINLGDLFISVDTARRQARDSSISIEQELVELTIHGVLHLLGFDHEISDEEMKKMYEKEHQLFDYYKSLKNN